MSVRDQVSWTGLMSLRALCLQNQDQGQFLKIPSIITKAIAKGMIADLEVPVSILLRAELN